MFILSVTLDVRRLACNLTRFKIASCITQFAHSSGVSPSERAAGKAARTAKMGGKRDTKAAKAKRAERRGKGALKTEQKTAIAEGKQERKKAFAKDEEDLDALQHSQSAAWALCQLGSCAS